MSRLRGKNKMSDKREKGLNCMFSSERVCPVRKEMRGSLDVKKQIDKYIKPLGDKELLKLYGPILDKIQKMMVNEFGVLHNYCKVCPLLGTPSKKEAQNK